MSNFDEMQDNQDQGLNINDGLGGNLVQEGSANFEGEQDQNGFQIYPNNLDQNEKPQTIGSDHSFHADKKFDDFIKADKFAEKEKKISRQLDGILQEKLGYSTSKFVGYTFMINKILFLTTFTEFLFQRFDVVTLFICIVVILIELEIFSHKHLYKWLAVLICSFLLDALVLIDISPVSKNFFLVFNINRPVILI